MSEIQGVENYSIEVCHVGSWSVLNTLKDCEQSFTEVLAVTPKDLVAADVNPSLTHRPVPPAQW